MEIPFIRIPSDYGDDYDSYRPLRATGRCRIQTGGSLKNTVRRYVQHRKWWGLPEWIPWEDVVWLPKPEEFDFRVPLVTDQVFQSIIDEYNQTGTWKVNVNS